MNDRYNRSFGCSFILMVIYPNFIKVKFFHWIRLPASVVILDREQFPFAIRFGVVG